MNQHIEIIDLTGDDDMDTTVARRDATVARRDATVARRVLLAAVSRVAMGTVPAMFLSDSAIRRAGVAAPSARLTTCNLPRLGLCGGTRFWTIDGPVTAEALRHKLREFHVLSLDNVPVLERDGVAEVLRLREARLMSDAVVRGTDFFGPMDDGGGHESCEVMVFFTKSLRRVADRSLAAWSDADGACWTVQRWWGVCEDDGGGDVAPDDSLAHTAFVLNY